MDKKELCEESLSAVSGGISPEEVLAQGQARKDEITATMNPLKDVNMDSVLQKWSLDCKEAAEAAESARLEAAGGPRGSAQILAEGVSGIMEAMNGKLG